MRGGGVIDVGAIKLGNIRTDRQGDAQFALVLGLAIILRQTLSDVVGSKPHYRVGIGVVVRGAMEDIGAKSTLLYLSSVSIQR
jgi:hypothetical protein